ncbi:MAG: GNAT family N-acetyltransferase [Cyanobacteria bacterium P01_A01_bin.84]
MTENFQLLPGFIIRHGRSRDAWQIKKVLSTFDTKENNTGIILIIFLVTIVTGLIFSPAIALYLLGIILLFYFYEINFKNYSNYLVVENISNNSIVACVELRNYKKYSVIVNLCVLKEYRRRQFASCLIRQVINEAQKPAYLVCLSELIPFYHRFGFIAISPAQISWEIKTELGLHRDLILYTLVLS